MSEQADAGLFTQRPDQRTSDKSGDAGDQHISHLHGASSNIFVRYLLYTLKLFVFIPFSRQPLMISSFSMILLLSPRELTPPFRMVTIVIGMYLYRRLFTYRKRIRSS